MAIAHDAGVISGALTSTGSWTHTPVGTPRGFMVVAVQPLSEVAQVADGDVDIGGVNVPLIGSIAKATGEPMRADIFFLGSGIPTGAQTVTATFSNDVNANLRLRSYSVTAAADTEVVDFDAVSSGSLANPSVSLDNPSARECYVVAGLGSGHGDVTSHAAGTDYTSDNTADPGLATSRWEHITTPSTSDPIVVDFTQAAEDVVLVALAIAEVAAAGGTVAGPMSGIDDGAEIGLDGEAGGRVTVGLHTIDEGICA
jgi:hypothetical protein